VGFGFRQYAKKQAKPLLGAAAKTTLPRTATWL
jgi:hypothetical protein